MTTGELREQEDQDQATIPETMQEDSIGACRGMAITILAVFVGAVIIGGIVALIKIFVWR
jgi:hypothetical protein